MKKRFTTSNLPSIFDNKGEYLGMVYFNLGMDFSCIKKGLIERLTL